MNILIIGHAGYVGPVLVDQLFKNKDYNSFNSTLDPRADHTQYPPTLVETGGIPESVQRRERDKRGFVG